MERVLRAVDHGEDVDLIGFDVVDQPVRAAEYFPYLVDIVFGDAPPCQRECPDLL